VLHNWSTIAFGWPAVITALALFIVALLLRRSSVAVVAGLLSAPFCVSVSGYPLIREVGLVVLGGNVIGVIALWRGHLGVAAASWLPFIALAGFLAILVLKQPL
jgi:hypothetical protein